MVARPHRAAPGRQRSLLDEGTAAAEAMHLVPLLHAEGRALLRLQRLPPADDRGRKARAPSRSASRSSSATTFDFSPEPVFGVLLQYPDTDGR
jgi:glycine cleavage system pyridoxal-binding protein P